MKLPTESPVCCEGMGVKLGKMALEPHIKAALPAQVMTGTARYSGPALLDAERGPAAGRKEVVPRDFARLL